MKVAMNYHLVARTHSCRGDFRAALQSEKEAYAIYKQTVSKSNISSISSRSFMGNIMYYLYFCDTLFFTFYESF